MRRPDGIEEQSRRCERSSRTNAVALKMSAAIAAGFWKPKKGFGMMLLFGDELTKI